MGLLDVRTMVVITSRFPDFREKKKSGDVFSPDEIDGLDPGMLSGMSREQLALLRKKLSDISDELYADCDPGTPEWEALERRMDKLDEMMNWIDEVIEPGEDCV